MTAEAFQILIGIAAIGCACGKTLIDAGEDTLGPRGPGAGGSSGCGAGNVGGHEGRWDSGHSDRNASLLAEVQTIVNDSSDFLRGLALGIGTVPVTSNKFLMLAEASGIVLGAAEWFTGGNSLVHTSKDALRPRGPGSCGGGGGGAGNIGGHEGRWDGGHSDGDSGFLAEVQAVVDHASDFLGRLALSIGAVPVTSHKFLMLTEASGVVLGATEGFAGSNSLIHTGEDTFRPGSPAGAGGGSGRAGGFTGRRLRSRLRGRFDSGLCGGRASGDVNWGTELLREGSALRGM